MARRWTSASDASPSYNQHYTTSCIHWEANCWEVMGAPSWKSLRSFYLAQSRSLPNRTTGHLLSYGTSKEWGGGWFQACHEHDSASWRPGLWLVVNCYWRAGKVLLRFLSRQGWGSWLQPCVRINTAIKYATDGPQRTRSTITEERPHIQWQCDMWETHSFHNVKN